MRLQRLVIDVRPEDLVLRVLYRSQDGPNPGTKARSREIRELARDGLTQALQAIEGRVDVVGESGFTTREDILLATFSSDEVKTAKRGA